ncbi:MAG: hypothetical protein ACOYMT_05260, partial [Chthoniobacterales bacterium]
RSRCRRSGRVSLASAPSPSLPATLPFRQLEKRLPAVSSGRRGDTEEKSGNQEIRKKRWNKTVVLNLNTEIREEGYRLTGFP